MAKNPLYRSEFYFFSNMYDDSLIGDFYKKISAESYERSVLYQQNMLGRKRHRSDSAIFYQATLGEFIVDDKYNASVDLPLGSRTLKFNTLIIPVHNKRAYISTYGFTNRKIPLTDFYTRKDIFDKSISLQIGKYHIMSAYLIENADMSVTLAISNSNADGISTAHFARILSEYSSNEPVWIFSDEITQLYYADTTSAAAFSSAAVAGYYDVSINKSSALNNIGASRNHDPANSWDCLISFNNNTHGKKLLVTTTCTLKATTSTQMIFSVNEKFINMIKASSANFNLLFIHRPNRRSILYHPYSQNTSPILNLDYTCNPVGNINIEVFEINGYTMCKGRKLYDPEFTQMYFPNIFNFSTLNENHSALSIEITEYAPSYTNQVMNNSLTPLIKSLGSEKYTEFVVNDHDRSIGGISMGLKQYHPTYYPVSASDYIGSEYYKDPRGYILDKITKTIESDPYLIHSYYKWMIDKNQKVSTLSGTPKTVRFNTGRSGEFSGANRIVSDTSLISITPEDIQYFVEPHSYITYHSSMKPCPAMVYLNGKYITPTCTRFFKGVNYLFFPVSKINAAMQQYANEAALIDASPITIESYPNTYISKDECPKDVIIINSASDSIRLFKDIDNPEFELDDIMLYNASTGAYLGSLLDLFDINLFVSEYDIDTPTTSDKILLRRGEDINYLLTSLGEVYTTMDLSSIIISENNVNLNLNSFIDELVEEGIISAADTSAFTHKKLNFKDVELIPKDVSLVGLAIGVQLRSFKSEQMIHSNSGTYNAQTGETSYLINGACVDNKMSRYFAFINGSLDPLATFTSVDNIYNGKLSITVQGNQTLTDKEILIIHVPIDYEVSPFNVNSRVFYMKPAVASAIDTAQLWPNGTTDGVILQVYTGDIYNSFAFENEVNLKFSAGGLRLPPKSESTNSLYKQYYDANRATKYGLVDGAIGCGYFVKSDLPIMSLAKQNPYASSYDASYLKNPLDILTYMT